MKYFAERLRIARKCANKTQQEVADYLGIQPTAITNWEKGIREPNIYTIDKIANFLHCDIDYLFCCDEETQKMFYKFMRKRKEEPNETPVGWSSFFMMLEWLNEDELKQVLAIEPKGRHAMQLTPLNSYKGEYVSLVVIDNTHKYPFGAEDDAFIEFEIVQADMLEPIGSLQFRGINNKYGIFGTINARTLKSYDMKEDLCKLAIIAIKGELQERCENLGIKQIVLYNGFNMEKPTEKILAIAFEDGEIPTNIEKDILTIGKGGKK